MQLNFEQIKKLLPQRYPYLMVDKVLELEPGKTIVAVKNVTGNEAYFSGHFPEIAIMPGTAIIEAMVYIFRPFGTLRRYLSLRLDTALGHCFG